MSFGSLSFAAPWALAALAALPVIWWLLRLTPPAPARMIFPPLSILARLTKQDDTAEKSPPWLIAIRLALASALIFALADPIMNPGRNIGTGGPLLVVVDDGWASARDWQARQDALKRLLDQAAREGRAVALVKTAPIAPGLQEAEIGLVPAREALSQAEALRPKPWPADRIAALERIRESGALATAQPAAIVWLTDGLAGDGDGEWIDGLRQLAPLRVIRDEPGRSPVVLLPPETDGEAMAVTAQRAAGLPERNVWVRAFDSDGAILTRKEMTFESEAETASSEIDLPTELRNRLVRLDIENEATAASTVLLDERWRRRPVGLVTGETGIGAQPLLGEFYYIERALSPFTDVRRGKISDLLERRMAVLVLGDSSPMSVNDGEDLARWVERGGLLIRFAGPRLADTTLDPAQGGLLPVPLRPGGRTMGGALSWNRPAALAPFPDGSPFAGLTIPEDVVVFQQVLARPALDLAENTWATLDDGTPLITADRRGAGWTVLIHTSANTAWSNLSISGLFVEMLRRVVAASRGAVEGASGTSTLPPLEMLDGFGILGPPSPGAIGIDAPDFDQTRASPSHPPGFYGKAESRRALNLSAGISAPRHLDPLPQGVEVERFGSAPEILIAPWLFGLAMLLFLADLIAALALRGLLRSRAMTAAAVATLAVLIWNHEIYAQTAESDFERAASLTTRLAYVETGNESIDNNSLAGLRGLSVIVNRRTAAELGDPIGIDLESDNLVFFPFLYWPLVEGALPSENAAARVRDYMAGGGVVLFDTRDPDGAVPIATLRAMAERLRIPPLIPAPSDHVLTRAYYLLRSFPGRWAGGDLWVEKAGERVNDGVSPVIVGSNDWAGAWAMDVAQRPLYAVVPGGERQREMAYRFGINLVMYTLTGNYKADQVHLPAILERLGL
ncbi:MAG: DUF4159 domain-containing protein [Rhodospirillales bacterium]|nr:DUF4159 domain-containing protein [Rhodospirillales bacterium]